MIEIKTSSLDELRKWLDSSVPRTRDLGKIETTDVQPIESSIVCHLQDKIIDQAMRIEKLGNDLDQLGNAFQEEQDFRWQDAQDYGEKIDALEAEKKALQDRLSLKLTRTISPGMKLEAIKTLRNKLNPGVLGCKDAKEIIEALINCLLEAQQYPIDFEPCGDCGFDHTYEYEAAHAFHGG